MTSLLIEFIVLEVEEGEKKLIEQQTPLKFANQLPEARNHTNCGMSFEKMKYANHLGLGPTTV